jgi:hypothetical protein
MQQRGCATGASSLARRYVEYQDDRRRAMSKKSEQRTLYTIRAERERIGEARRRVQDGLRELAAARDDASLEEVRLQEESLRAGRPANASRRFREVEERKRLLEGQLPVISSIEQKLAVEELRLQIDQIQGEKQVRGEELANADRALRAAQHKRDRASYAALAIGRRLSDLTIRLRNAEDALAAVDVPQRASNILGSLRT